MSSAFGLGKGLVLLSMILASRILKFFFVSKRFLTDSLAILLLARPPILLVLPAERLLLTDSMSDYFLERFIWNGNIFWVLFRASNAFLERMFLFVIVWLVRSILSSFGTTDFMV